MGDSVIHHNFPFSLFMKVIPFKQKGKSIFAAREKFFRLSGKGRSCLRKRKNRKEIRRVRCCCLMLTFFSSILRIRIFCIVCCSIFFISIISISIIIGFLKNRSVFSQSKVLLQKLRGASGFAQQHLFQYPYQHPYPYLYPCPYPYPCPYQYLYLYSFFGFFKKGVVFLMMLKKG